MTITAEPTVRLGRGRHQSRLEAIERLLMAVDANSMLDGHPLPDLTGAGPVEIAAALAAATLTAHAEDWSLHEAGSDSDYTLPAALKLAGRLDEAVSELRKGLGKRSGRDGEWAESYRRFAEHLVPGLGDTIVTDRASETQQL